MGENQKFRTGALLGSISVAVALAWAAVVHAQGATPTGNSFGGGTAGFTGSSGFGGFTGSSFSGSSFSGSSFSGSSFSGSSFSGGFFTGGTSGTSFAGSSAMNSSNRGFSGNWAASFSGGANRGSSATGTLGTTGIYGGGATGGGANSAFSPYYFNPLAAGVPNVTTPPSFTSPIYAGNATGGAQGSFGGTGGISGYPSQPNQPSGNSATGPNTGSRRSPYYTASPGFDYRPAGPSRVQGDVERVLARSTSLSPNRNIRVAVEGPVVVLRGTVATEQERQLAEALVRLTPGVFDVRNELEVRGTISRSGSGP